jgi:hypothetical protein
MARIECVSERWRTLRRRGAGEAAVRLQVELRPPGLRQRPIRCGTPTAAVIEPSRRIAAPRAAAHHKDAHRWIGNGRAVLEPAVVPGKAQGKKILRQIAVDRRHGAEIDGARIAQRAVAMGPRAEDQPHRGALLTLETKVIFGCGPRIGIVPTGEMNDRHIGIAPIVTFGVDPGALPEIVECSVRPLLEEIVLVIRRGGHRRLALAPRHPREPCLDVLGSECRLDCLLPGVGERVVVGPGRLLQVKGTTMADTAAVRVRKPAAVEQLRGETRRVEAAERCLAMPGVREAERANPAVAPGLMSGDMKN